MKYLLLTFFVISVFISCSKDDDSQISNTRTPVMLQNKTWLLDSFITLTPNYSNTVYADANEEQTLVFSNDTLVKSTGSYRITYNTSYDGTANLYYWLPGSVDTKSMYWQIVSVTDFNLVTKEFPQPDRTVTSYYHVK